MKTLQKVFVILIVTFCVLGVMPQNISMAAGDDTADIVSNVTPESPQGDLVTGAQSIIGKVLGFLQIASGLAAIVMIAITGFNYIVATPQLKEEMKNKALPIIVGLVLVFGAVSIAKFVLGIVS